MAEKVKRQVMVIDPTLQYERRLKYQEKHAVWEIFKMVYWGIYIFLVGFILLIFDRSASPTPLDLYSFFGWIISLFALFYILYGFSTSLHLRLMRKYA
ncbi:MAG: hypothetical protein M1504_02805 [Candidatus Marsarchaeota archaeon]|nr:hypothetical protein [Candidatus Marsarchaeota archaeon]